MTSHPHTSSALETPSPALAAIAQQHLDMVHATALSQLHDPHLADDATQAVFLLLLRRQDNLPPTPFLPGWLYKTTCYVAAEIRRQNLRRQRRDQEAHPMPPSPDPTSHAMTHEQRTALHAAIARLPATDRTTVVLSYLEGRSTAETAASLGTSETAVRIRLSRARERLRTLLRRAGITLSAAALLSVLETSKATAAPAALLPTVHALLQGAAPASHVLSLVQGALQMTIRLKLLITATFLALLALSLGIYVATFANSNPTPSPASAPASAPAAITRLSPKQAFLAVFQNAMAGDEKAVLNAFDQLDDNRATIIRRAVAAMVAYNDLARVVKEKLNFDLGPLLSETLRTGMDAADIEKSSEAIDGDTAQIILNLNQVSNAQPLSLPMVKVGDEWKISSAIFQRLNLNAVSATGDMEPAFRQLAADVRAGKFTTAADFQSALARAAKKPSTRP